ncbi:MAG: tetratricopeptide repeat protein, partial [Candidatus Obscuribacterales bacterium]|nr:tetratricopeptide repeat protein [Candidatus Obscuribacterales bacterium]
MDGGHFMFARLCLALLFVLAINFQVCSQAVARESGWDKHAVKAWHYYNLGVYDRCEKELLTALQSIGDSVDTRLATTLNNLAAVYAEKGQYAHAEKLYARAIEVYGVHLDALDPFVVVAQNNLAVLYYNQRRYREAEVLYSQVIGSGETAFGFDSAAFALSLNNLAAIQAGQKRYSGALSLLRRALSIHEKNGTTRSAAYASVLN